MASFQDMIGQTKLLKHMQGALQSGRISHAWLLDGEKGMGKKTLAGIFARALLCETGGDTPCDVCHSCRTALSGNHPDLITVTHEKPLTLSVEEIRSQVVDDIRIRPYSSRRKVYIIPDAHLMTPSAQNALLKTLEEPPSYAVILLLSDNKEMLLPTLISRSVCLSMRPLRKEEIRDYLENKKGVSKEKAELAASFSRGSLGRAILLAEGESFSEMWEIVRGALVRAREMNMPSFTETAGKAAVFKDQREDLMDFFLLWFRDILLIKSGGGEEGLVFREDEEELRRQADTYTFEELNRLIGETQETRARLNANVNFELSLELLLSEIREPGSTGRIWSEATSN